MQLVRLLKALKKHRPGPTCFVIYFKMSSFFHERLEDQPVSAFYTLKSFWPDTFYFFFVLALCLNAWSNLCAQHCARVFSWIIFIGNKLFRFPGNEAICYGSTFAETPINPPTVHTCNTLMLTDAHGHTHRKISSLLKNAVRFINNKNWH